MTLTATNDESALTWGDPKRERRAERKRIAQHRSVTQAWLDWLSNPPPDYHEALWATRSELTRHPADYTDAELRETANRLLPVIEELTDRTQDENAWGEDGEAWWTARVRRARLEGRWDAIASELQSRKRDRRHVGATCAPGLAPFTWAPGSDPFIEE